MLGQCSLRHRFQVCSSGGNSNRKSSFWRLVGTRVFPCRTRTFRSCLPSEACKPITSRCVLFVSLIDTYLGANEAFDKKQMQS